jgi:CubicO group peptidase (beta-lactamase class C family)
MIDGGSLESMKRLILTLFLAAALVASPRAADNLVFAVFGDYLESLRVQAGIPGLAATIVSTSDVSWERGFGQQDVDRNIVVRSDTPFHLDGLTQFVVASLALRCHESGWISIDDRVASFVPSSPDAGSTLRMLMTHTSAGPAGLVFSYRLDRLAPMASAIPVCTDSTFRYGIAALLDRMGMADTVPGSDAAALTPGTEGFDGGALGRYRSALARLAVPYAVDARGRPTPSRYSSTSLTPSGGLISTARDLAKFDLALKNGFVVRRETLALAWSAPANLNGQALPHGIGWFVQTYEREPVIWQFGIGDNASSSMIVTLPRRGLTLILLANSSGLVQGFNLAAGDVTVSPFARLFLGTFVR